MDQATKDALLAEFDPPGLRSDITVAQFIEILKRCPQDASIVAYYDSGYGSVFPYYVIYEDGMVKFAKDVCDIYLEHFNDNLEDDDWWFHKAAYIKSKQV